MPHLPPVGTRVSLRYRLPEGSVPPLSDVVGRLLEVAPVIKVRTKSDAVVDVAPADVVSVRALTEAPVRNSQIRNLEYAAAMAWPGTEQHWLDGWFLRFSSGASHRANSAVPLDVHASMMALPAVVDWYRERSAIPWLALPDRLVRLPGHATDAPAILESLVMTTELSAPPEDFASVSARPDERWMHVHDRGLDVDVLTAVLDGEVGFATRASAAVGRAAVTAAPDGTRWAGLAAVRVAEDHRREGHGRALCSTLLAWAAGRGATRGYVQVLADNTAGRGLYESMGFTTQHRVRYVDGRTL